MGSPRTPYAAKRVKTASSAPMHPAAGCSSGRWKTGSPGAAVPGAPRTSWMRWRTELRLVLPLKFGRYRYRAGFKPCCGAPPRSPACALPRTWQPPFDRRLLATRPAQDPAQFGVHAGQRRRQRLPDSSQLGKAGLRRLPAGSRRPHGLVQPGILLALPVDRGLLATRPSQDVAQVSDLVEGQFRQRRSGRAELGNPGRQLLLPGLRHAQGEAQTVSLVGQRPRPGFAVAQYPQLPVETEGLAGQRPGGLPDALRALLLPVQLLVEFTDRLVPPGHFLVEPGDVLAQGSDRDFQARLCRGCPIPAGFPGAPSDDVFHGPRLSQDLHRAGLARSDAGIGKQSLQAPHRCPQRGRGLCRAAQVLRLLHRLAQPAPAGPEARFPRTGIATGGHFRPAQLLTARFRRLRPRPLLLIQGLEIARRDRRCRLGQRPYPVAFGQRRVYAEIIVQNRHALDDSARQNMLPAPL